MPIVPGQGFIDLRLLTFTLNKTITLHFFVHHEPTNSFPQQTDENMQFYFILREVDQVLRLTSEDEWMFNTSRRSEQSVRTVVNQICDEHIWASPAELKALKLLGVLSTRAQKAALITPQILVKILRHFNSDINALIFESILITFLSEQRLLRNTLLGLSHAVYQYNLRHGLDHTDETSFNLLQNLTTLNGTNKTPYPPPWQRYFGQNAPVLDLKLNLLLSAALRHPKTSSAISIFNTLHHPVNHQGELKTKQRANNDTNDVKTSKKGKKMGKRKVATRKDSDTGFDDDGIGPNELNPNSILDSSNESNNTQLSAVDSIHSVDNIGVDQELIHDLNKLSLHTVINSRDGETNLTLEYPGLAEETSNTLKKLNNRLSTLFNSPATTSTFQLSFQAHGSDGIPTTTRFPSFIPQNKSSSTSQIDFHSSNHSGFENNLFNPFTSSPTLDGLTLSSLSQSSSSTSHLLPSQHSQYSHKITSFSSTPSILSPSTLTSSTLTPSTLTPSMSSTSSTYSTCPINSSTSARYFNPAMIFTPQIPNVHHLNQLISKNFNTHLSTLASTPFNTIPSNVFKLIPHGANRTNIAHQFHHDQILPISLPLQPEQQRVNKIYPYLQFSHQPFSLPFLSTILFHPTIYNAYSCAHWFTKDYPQFLLKHQCKHLNESLQFSASSEKSIVDPLYESKKEQEYQLDQHQSGQLAQGLRTSAPIHNVSPNKNNEHRGILHYAKPLPPLPADDDCLDGDCSIVKKKIKKNPNADPLILDFCPNPLDNHDNSQYNHSAYSITISSCVLIDSSLSRRTNKFATMDDDIISESQRIITRTFEKKQRMELKKQQHEDMMTEDDLQNHNALKALGLNLDILYESEDEDNDDDNNIDDDEHDQNDYRNKNFNLDSHNHSSTNYTRKSNNNNNSDPIPDINDILSAPLLPLSTIQTFGLFDHTTVDNSMTINNFPSSAFSPKIVMGRLDQEATSALYGPRHGSIMNSALINQIGHNFTPAASIDANPLAQNTPNHPTAYPNPTTISSNISSSAPQFIDLDVNKPQSIYTLNETVQQSLMKTLFLPPTPVFTFDHLLKYAPEFIKPSPTSSPCIDCVFKQYEYEQQFPECTRTMRYIAQHYSPTFQNPCFCAQTKQNITKYPHELFAIESTQSDPRHKVGHDNDLYTIPSIVSFSTLLALSVIYYRTRHPEGSIIASNDFVEMNVTSTSTTSPDIQSPTTHSTTPSTTTSTISSPNLSTDINEQYTSQILINAFRWLTTRLKYPVVFSTALIEFDFETTKLIYQTQNETPPPLFIVPDIAPEAFSRTSINNVHPHNISHIMSDLKNTSSPTLVSISTPQLPHHQNFPNSRQTQPTLLSSSVTSPQADTARSFVDILATQLEDDLLLSSIDYINVKFNHQANASLLSTTPIPSLLPQTLANSAFPYEITSQTIPLFRSFLYHLNQIPPKMKLRLLRHSCLTFALSAADTLIWPNGNSTPGNLTEMQCNCLDQATNVQESQDCGVALDHAPDAQTNLISIAPEKKKKLNPPQIKAQKRLQTQQRAAAKKLEQQRMLKEKSLDGMGPNANDHQANLDDSSEHTYVGPQNDNEDAIEQIAKKKTVRTVTHQLPHLKQDIYNVVTKNGYDQHNEQISENNPLISLDHNSNELRASKVSISPRNFYETTLTSHPTYDTSFSNMANGTNNKDLDLNWYQSHNTNNKINPNVNVPAVFDGSITPPANYSALESNSNLLDKSNPQKLFDYDAANNFTEFSYNRYTVPYSSPPPLTPPSQSQSFFQDPLLHPITLIPMQPQTSTLTTTYSSMYATPVVLHQPHLTVNHSTSLLLDDVNIFSPINQMNSHIPTTSTTPTAAPTKSTPLSLTNSWNSMGLPSLQYTSESLTPASFQLLPPLSRTTSTAQTHEVTLSKVMAPIKGLSTTKTSGKTLGKSSGKNMHTTFQSTNNNATNSVHGSTQAGKDYGNMSLYQLTGFLPVYSHLQDISLNDLGLTSGTPLQSMNTIEQYPHNNNTIYNSSHPNTPQALQIPSLGASQQPFITDIYPQSSNPIFQHQTQTQQDQRTLPLENRDLLPSFFSHNNLSHSNGDFNTMDFINSSPILTFNDHANSEQPREFALLPPPQASFLGQISSTPTNSMNDGFSP